MEGWAITLIIVAIYLAIGKYVWKIGEKIIPEEEKKENPHKHILIELAWPIVIFVAIWFAIFDKDE